MLKNILKSKLENAYQNRPHCLISAQENVPQFIRITKAATNDHTILKQIQLARRYFSAIDRFI